MTVRLLESCQDKEQANAQLHVHAQALKNMGLTPMYRVKVMYRKGWGVWLTVRNER